MSTLDGMLDAARTWVARARPTGPLAGALQPLDVGSIASELDLRRRGAERGQLGLPRADQTSFDEVEQEIIQAISSTWTVQRDEALGTSKALRDSLARFNLETQVAELTLVAQSALSRFTGARQQIRGELSRLFDAALTATRELQAFRGEHGLTRSARPHKSPWMTQGLLGFFIVAESLLNGLFFAEGSDAGLLGGVGIAFGISFVNVAGCFLTGLLPARYTNVRHTPTRFGAWVATSILGIAIGLLHLFAGHYRAAVRAHGESAAYEIALSTISTAPFPLPDMLSWYLFGLGLLFALGAFWKGYTQDDPYPRYGAISREAVKAEQDYDDAYQELFEQLDSVRDDAITRFDTAVRNMPAEAQHAASAHAQAIALARRFAGYEDHLEQCANSLLTIYRDANRGARTAGTDPSHFSRQWKLAPRTVFDLPVMPTGDIAAQKNAHDEIARLHDSVLARYGELLTEADHPESLRARLR